MFCGRTNIWEGELHYYGNFKFQMENIVVEASRFVILNKKIIKFCELGQKRKDFLKTVEINKLKEYNTHECI